MNYWKSDISNHLLITVRFFVLVVELLLIEEI